MPFEPTKLRLKMPAVRRHPAQGGGRVVGSVVTGVAREIDVVDLVEILMVPMFVYVAHRLDDIAKNYVEPERCLLRPRVRRA